MRSFLGQDDDGHWYLIPVKNRTAWERWVGSGKVEVPNYALAIGGSPSRVTFLDARIG